MELDLGPEIARFRGELRDWIAAAAPAGPLGLLDWYVPMTAGASELFLGDASYHRDRLATRIGL